MDIAARRKGALRFVRWDAAGAFRARKSKKGVAAIGN
jgi:hypothetical protein